MDIILTLKAVIMGLVEGLTEFLPISSTGHLILAGSLLNFTAEITREKAEVFEIAIQVGAIFAVCWEYRVRIAGVIRGFSHDPKARQLIYNLIAAFIPAALFGLILGKLIKDKLFAPLPVAIALIVGGLIILWVERHHKTHPGSITRIESIDQIHLGDAFKIGLFQACALIPGTSRSGATIIGGMLLGMSRKVATEFSFFLAIPTLFAAALYSLYKDRALLSANDLPLFSIGTIAAFASAFICIRWLLRYVSNHDFTVFAWYRIGFGLIIIASSYSGWVDWAH